MIRETPASAFEGTLQILGKHEHVPEPRLAWR